MPLKLWIYSGLKNLTRRRRGSFAHSSLVSLVIRPLMEKDQAKLWLGAPLATLAIVGGVSQMPEGNVVVTAWEVEQPITQLIDVEYELPVITAESRYELPVAVLLGVSQGYHAGHQAVDFRAPLGSKVKTVDAGVVEEVIYSRFGYGTHIYVTHENRERTLYSHLGEVSVAPGQYVSKNQPIAEIGMTGLSTGPHLHFEMQIEGIKVNPLYYLSESILDYQKSLTAGN